MGHDQIAQLLQQRTGLDAATLGHGVIEHAVRKRSGVLFIEDVQTYEERVRDCEAEFQELVESLVIPETWFFRDKAAFAGLSQFAAHEWLPASATGVLQILSIPCSTGEEPYSIAMALVEAGLPTSRFRIDAMDISMKALESAKTAVFRKNSFRGQIGEFRERYFVETPAGYVLCDSIRSLVEFRHGNLLKLSEYTGNKRYDAIFCRNVLIYFDPASREAVLPLLADHLQPNGLLFVGPAETVLNSRLGFVTSNDLGTFVYRKTGVRRESDVARLPVAPILKEKTFDRAPGRTPRPAKTQKAIGMTPATYSPPASSQTSDIDSIMAMADAGQVAEARSRCEAHLAELGDSPRACYLMALLEDSIGHSQRAIEFYRKAIYLDPNYAEALSHLALLLDKQGNTVQARHLQSRARRIEERTIG